MAIPRSAHVHPTAILTGDIVLGENVRVGPYAVLEGPISLGENTVVRPHAHFVGPLTVGRDNDFGTGAIVGERPQHLRDAGDGTETVIGDGNIFREHVTIHRGTQASKRTVIGNHNFLMAGAHVAHDCVVGDHVTMANNALLGGHVTVEDRAFLSGNAAVHQFVKIGRLAFLSGLSATTKDIPPFLIQQDFNRIMGVNVVGMRRAGLAAEQIDGVREAYRILFMRRMLLSAGVEAVERQLGHLEAVAEMIAFIRSAQRGIAGGHRSEAA